MANPNPATADATTQKAETVPETKVEATAEPAKDINSAPPKTENKAESLPTGSQYLSPYPAVSSFFFFPLNSLDYEAYSKFLTPFNHLFG